MAGQIAYSTLTVTLTCTALPEAPARATLGERVGGAFGDSVDGTIRALQGIAVFLAGAVIPFALLAVIGFVGYKIVAAIVRKARLPV
jgi:hypothetical protein